MSLSQIAMWVRDALITLAKEVVQFAISTAKQLVLDGIAWVVERLATEVHGYAQRQRAAGVSEDAIGTRVTDTLVASLDAVRADLIRRRETLTAEQALAAFREGMALPQFAS